MKRLLTVCLLSALGLGALAAAATALEPPETLNRTYEDSTGEARATSTEWLAFLKGTDGSELARVRIDLASKEIESVIDGKKEEGRLESLEKADLERTLEALHVAWQASALDKTFPMKAGCGQCRDQVGCCVNCCDSFGCTVRCFWVSLPSPTP